MFHPMSHEQKEKQHSSALWCCEDPLCQAGSPQDSQHQLLNLPSRGRDSALSLRCTRGCRHQHLTAAHGTSMAVPALLQLQPMAEVSSQSHVCPGLTYPKCPLREQL